MGTFPGVMMWCVVRSFECENTQGLVKPRIWICRQFVLFYLRLLIALFIRKIDFHFALVNS